MLSFKETNGDLFVYGFGFKENDQHLIERITKSKIQNLYVGVRSQSSYKRIQPTLDLMKEKRLQLVGKGKRKNTLEIHCYDAQTANVWNNI